MHAAARLLLIAAGTYAGVCGLLVVGRNRLVFPIRGGDAGDPRRFGMPDGAVVSIPTSDGERLAAWWLPPRAAGGRTGAVVWLHGNGERVAGLGPVIRELRPDGAGLLVPDYRGYGASTGRTTVAGTLRDAEAAWDWLAARPEVDASRIVVYGRSVGSGPAAHLAAVRPAAGLILESAFTSLRAMARQHYPVFPSVLAGSGFDNLSAVARVRAPLLLMHGERDDIVPLAMGRALAAAAAGPVELWVIPGAGHNETYDAGDEEYVRRFKAFVAKVTGAFPPAAPGTPGVH